MHAHVAGDDGAVMAFFLQGVNLVSLLTGELRVAIHRCLFDVAVKVGTQATAACP
jgi:hypothetical protein